MSKKNTTRYIILGLLNHENMSGYDIKKRIDIMVSHFWSVGYGQIYPTLSEMEREGLIVKCAEVNARGPQKNTYSITEEGRSSLGGWLLLPEEKEYTKYEILLKLFFGSHLPVQNHMDRIAAFQERGLENLKMIRLFKEDLGSVLSKESDHLYYYMTVLFGEHVYSAYVKWADEAMELLKAAKESENKAAAGDAQPGDVL